VCLGSYLLVLEGWWLLIKVAFWAMAFCVSNEIEIKKQQVRQKGI
jgi:hypothetical protein